MGPKAFPISIFVRYSPQPAQDKDKAFPIPIIFEDLEQNFKFFKPFLHMQIFLNHALDPSPGRVLILKCFIY